MICAEDTKAKIYEDYHEKVLRFFCSKISSRPDAEDLCSEVFVKVYSRLDGFDESVSSLSTWIYHISQNTLFDFYRRIRNTEELDENIPQNDSFTDELCREEALDALADCLEALPEKERNIILLHYYKGLSLKDLADRLDLSYSYVKLLNARALKFIKKSLISVGFSADSFV